MDGGCFGSTVALVKGAALIEASEAQLREPADTDIPPARKIVVTIPEGQAT